MGLLNCDTTHRGVGQDGGPHFSLVVVTPAEATCQPRERCAMLRTVCIFLDGTRYTLDGTLA
jgi:hypothetical protein